MRFFIIVVMPKEGSTSYLEVEMTSTIFEVSMSNTHMKMCIGQKVVWIITICLTTIWDKYTRDKNMSHYQYRWDYYQYN